MDFGMFLIIMIGLAVIAGLCYWAFYKSSIDVIEQIWNDRVYHEREVEEQLRKMNDKRDV